MNIENEIKTKFKSSHHKVVINIIYTANWLNYNIGKKLKEAGLTHPQYNVLRILRGRHPEVCSAGEVKEVMLDKTPDLTRLIDRMLEKGWVIRNQCPDNRRKVDISITKEGLELLSKVDPLIEQTVDAFDGLDENEANQLSDLVDKIRN